MTDSERLAELEAKWKTNMYPALSCSEMDELFIIVLRLQEGIKDVADRLSSIGDSNCSLAATSLRLVLNGVDVNEDLMP